MGSGRLGARGGNIGVAMAAGLLAFAVLAAAPAFPVSAQISPTARGSYNYQPGWGISSNYTISWDFSSVTTTDAQHIATVTLHVDSLVGQTEGVRTKQINVTIYNDASLYYSKSVSESVNLGKGDFWGPVQFPVALGSAGLGLDPQQTAQLTVKIAVTLDELSWPIGTPYSHSVTTPTFKISVSNPAVPPQPLVSTPQPVRSGVSASTIIVFCLFLFAISGVVRPALALPRKGAGGRYYDPGTGHFVGTWTVVKAFGSFVLGFAVVGLSQSSALLANFVGLAGGDVFGGGDLQAALGLMYLVVGIATNR